MDNTGNGARATIAPWRITVFLVAVVLIFSIFAYRLFGFQILQRESALEEAVENRTREISIPTQRGVIYDRNGIILASNIPAFNVVITPAQLPDDEGEIQEIYLELNNLTGVPVSKGSLDEPLIPCGDNLGISEMVSIGDTFAPFTPVAIKCDVDKEIAMAIMEKAIDMPGVSIVVDQVRDYPTGEITAGIIGYLGPIPAAEEEAYRQAGFLPGRDKVGYDGIEFSQNDALAGTPGRRVVEVDVAGQILRDIEAPKEAEPGLNLVLTIDTRLQQAATSILQDQMDFWNTFSGEIKITSGVVIAMNPRTGEILAMVYLPTFENNRLARFIPAYYYEQLIADATDPLFNHAVGAELPAGSVFKLVTSVGALNEGVVTPDQVLETPPKITIEQRYTAYTGSSRDFVDWNDAGFGSLSFVGGLANSSNVYFYKLGGGYPGEVEPGLGVCRLSTYARAMGFGDYLGIELASEADGLIPEDWPTWKRRNQGENWSTGDTYIASVGQGYVLATPLQVLVSAAVIANDGVLMRPTLIREVVDGEGNIVQSFEPEILRDLTKDALINQYSNPEGIGSCKVLRDEAGEPILTTVEPWVFEKIQEGMRRAVTHGTLDDVFDGVDVVAAGKTGTAEYCDEVALEKGLCIPGRWPSHAWTIAYAPFDEPEIAVVAFLYNGTEGSSVAGPVVRGVIEAYFELKSIDVTLGNP